MVLVTGGTGLVGSHLLYYLVQENDTVRAIYRSEEKLKTVEHIFSYYSEDYKSLFNKIEWIEADINDIPKLSTAFNGISKVYHCAALVSFDPNDYYKLRQVNIDGTANVVNLCIANKIKKLAYVSSVAAIGDSLTNSLIDEECEWNSEADHNVYAITKYGAEMEIWRGTQEGLDVVVINPGVIIGPGFWNASSSSLIKRIYKGLSHYTNGSTGYVDIHDVVKILIELYKSDIKNERYIIVAENLTFKDFLVTTSNHLNVKPPTKVASKSLLNIAWRLDWLKHKFTGKRRKLTKHNVRSLTTRSDYSNEKIKQELSWKFTSLEESISATSQLFLKDH